MDRAQFMKNIGATSPIISYEQAQASQGDPLNQRFATHGIKSSFAVETSPQPIMPDMPLPLRRPPQEQMPYPVDALGEFSEVVNVFAEGIKVPHAMAAASVLATLSMCTQSIANIITPDGRTIPLVLYMLSVADSGDRKSALDRAVLHAVHGVEKAWYKEYQAQLHTYEAALQVWEKQPKKSVK